MKTNGTFTGRKLDWLKCCSFDRRLEPYDFKVAFVIQQHLNEATETCWLSDETIADEAGGSARNTRRARKRLRELKWIDWKRTSTANIYVLCFGNINRMLDLMIKAREGRYERKKSRFRSSGRRFVRTPMAAQDAKVRSSRTDH